MSPRTSKKAPRVPIEGEDTCEVLSNQTAFFVRQLQDVETRDEFISAVIEGSDQVLEDPNAPMKRSPFIEIRRLASLLGIRSIPMITSDPDGEFVSEVRFIIERLSNLKEEDIETAISNIPEDELPSYREYFDDLNKLLQEVQEVVAINKGLESIGFSNFRFERNGKPEDYVIRELKGELVAISMANPVIPKIKEYLIIRGGTQEALALIQNPSMVKKDKYAIGIIVYPPKFKAQNKALERVVTGLQQTPITLIYPYGLYDWGLPTQDYLDLTVRTEGPRRDNCLYILPSRKGLEIPQVAFSPYPLVRVEIPIFGSRVLLDAKTGDLHPLFYENTS